MNQLIMLGSVYVKSQIPCCSLFDPYTHLREQDKEATKVYRVRDHAVGALSHAKPWCPETTSTEVAQAMSSMLA